MTAALSILAFVLGAVIGSFVTVVAHRVPRGEGFVTGRSRCPGCGHADRGPRQRPAGLVAAAARPLPRLRRADLGALSAHRARDSACSVAAPTWRSGDDDVGRAGARARLLRRAGRDHAHRPRAAADPERDRARRRDRRGRDRRHRATPASSPSGRSRRPRAGGILFLIALAYPRGMGMGDAKLVAMMGLYLGRAVAPAVLIGFLVGALVGVGADRPARRARRASRRSRSARSSLSAA